MSFAFDLKSTRSSLLAWYREHRRPLPWRQRFAETRHPYPVWVSEIMLQQTVIKAVIPVYERFLRLFPDVRSLANAEDSAVREAVRGLGYYRRFRLMHAAAKALVEKRVGLEDSASWPQSAEEWRELPGIGDYTSAAVSSIAFGDAAAVVDGNVERLFCRLLDIREAPNQPRLKREFKRLAQGFLDASAPGDFNQAMMELGQTVCTVASPACGTCPLASGCLANARGSQAKAPSPKMKSKVIDVALRLTIVRRRGEVALFERPMTARFLKGTWGFVTEQRTGAIWERDGGAPLRVSKGATTTLGEVRHSITHHRIKAEGIVVEAERLAAAAGAQWWPVEQIEVKLVSNLDRKAWRLYQAANGSA